MFGGMSDVSNRPGCPIGIHSLTLHSEARPSCSAVVGFGRLSMLNLERRRGGT